MNYFILLVILGLSIVGCEKLEYPHVSVIILNWKGWRDTIECLKSIYLINYPNYDVIIVNNGLEESLKNIEEYFKVVESKFFSYSNKNFPLKILDTSIEMRNKINGISNLNKQLILIKNDKNYGFAEGNNIGVEYALKNLKSDYILLLNNDTQVDVNFLNELVKVAESDKNIGSVQSLLLKNDKVSIDSLGQEMLIWGSADITDRFEKPLPPTFEIFGACAASALYRGNLIKKIGLFNKVFFVLLEDVDLSWRIRLSGMKSMLASNSWVYHKRGISESKSLNEVINIIIHEKPPETTFKMVS